MHSRSAASASWLDVMPSSRKRRMRICLPAVCILSVSAYLQFYYARSDDWASLSEFAWIGKSNPYAAEALENPYTAEALQKNPHLGWQPLLVPSPLGANFTWRECFKADPKKSGSDQPAGCRENPSEFGEAPPVEKDWIPDVTMLRKMLVYGKDRDGNPFPPPLSADLCENIGEKGATHGDSNRDCLRESMIRPTGTLQSKSNTVTITPSNHYGAGENGTKGSIEVPAPKVMCLVYTMVGAHASRIRAIRDTWAGGCDGFLAFSTKSDPRIPAISLKHDGPESYKNMWQKVRSIWKFVGANYLDDYDWFYIGGEDLFALPHNLKTYLAYIAHKDGAGPKTKGYYVGRRFFSRGPDAIPGKVYPKDYFHSGGPGYSLSQAALRKFLTVVDDAERCHAKKIISAEDVMMAQCLRGLGINTIDTRDAHGRERFHHLTPDFHFNWKPPTTKKYDWYEQFNLDWGLLQGKDCCAPDSGSFHYITPAVARHMQALLYSCDESWRLGKTESLPSVEGLGVVVSPLKKMKARGVKVRKVE